MNYGEYYIGYTDDITRFLKYPVRLFYYLLYVFLPLFVIIPNFLSGDKPYISKKMLKELHKDYWKSYRNNDFTRTLDAGSIYSDWHNIPTWVNRKDRQACVKYAKAFLKWGRLPNYKRHKLITRYLGIDSDYTGATKLIISDMANIPIPNEFVEKQIKLAKENKEY